MDNYEFKIGNIVDYWIGIKAGDPSGTGEIYALGDVGCGVSAWIKGCYGCVAVSHIELREYDSVQIGVRR